MLKANGFCLLLKKLSPCITTIVQGYEKGMLEHLVSSWGITVFRAAMYIGEGGYATDKSAGRQAQQQRQDLGFRRLGRLNVNVLHPCICAGSCE